MDQGALPLRLQVWGEDAPPDGAGKYHGAIAEGYDAKRVESPKWTAEQSIIQDMLMDLLPGATVLDIPIGTGRFLPFYVQRGLNVLGADISDDMLRQAAAKAGPLIRQNPAYGARIKLGIRDVRDLKLPEKSVEAAVMCRLTRWLSPEDCQQAIRELTRVAHRRVVFTARIANHPHARPLALFEEALPPDWHVERNEAGYVPEYRIVALAPKAFAWKR